MVKLIKISLIVIFLILVTLFLMIIFRHYDWSYENVMESHNRGYRITIALEKYYRENQRYPTALNDLVPRYIKNIKPPIPGNGIWNYYIWNNDGYYLGFTGDSDTDPVSNILNEYNKWGLDTK